MKAVSRVVQILAVVYGIAFGLAAGSWLGWRSVPALPTDAEAASIAQLIISGSPNRVVRDVYVFGDRRDEGWMSRVLGIEGYSPGAVELQFPTDLSGARVDAAPARLVADGWELVDRHRRHATVEAVRGPLRVEFRQTDDTTATVWITRTAPRSTALWAWLGGLGGGAIALAALLGLARLWAGARHRTAVAVLCGVGALALFPSTALVVVATALGDVAAEPLWGAYGLIGLRLLALLGALLVAAGVLLLVLARHRPESAALAPVTA